MVAGWVNDECCIAIHVLQSPNRGCGKLHVNDGGLSRSSHDVLEHRVQVVEVGGAELSSGGE